MEVIKSEKLRTKLVSYLQSEIREIDSERAGRLKKWEKFRRQRQGQLSEENKNQRFPDVPKIATPIGLISTNTIFAQTKAAFQQKPFFATEPVNKESKPDREIADAITKVLNTLADDPGSLDLDRMNNTILYEAASLGTQIVHVPWVEDAYSFTRNLGDNEERITVQRKKGPTIVPIRPEQFYTREYNYDLQRAPMIAMEYWLTEHELRQREDDQTYENIDKVLMHKDISVPRYMSEISKATGARVGKSELYRIFEVHVFWKTDEASKLLQDIKCWFHLESGTILREEFNNLGIRPFVVFNHMQIPYSIWGMGVGAIGEGLQDSYDALFHNSLISTMFASLQMAAAAKSSGIAENESMEMGKMFFVDGNPNDVLKVFEFPNTTQSNLLMMNMIQMLLDRGTGSTNAMSGFPDTIAKSGATATGTMFQANQGMRVLQSVTVEGLQQAFSKVGMLIVFQMILNRDRTEEILKPVPEKERKIFEQAVLTMTPEELAFRFNFKITVAQPDQTDEARKQKWLTLTQLYSMFGQQTIQMLQGLLTLEMQFAQAQTPTFMLLKESIMRLYAGANDLMDRILTEFGLPGSGYTAEVRDIEMLVSVMEQMRMMQTQMMLGGLNAGQNSNGMGAGSGAVQRLPGGISPGPQTSSGAPMVNQQPGQADTGQA